MDLFQRLGSVRRSDRVINFVGRLGLIESFKGELPRSEQLFEFLARIDPGNFLAYKELASIRQKLGKHERALEAVDVALRLNRNQSDILALRGSILANLERYDEAEPSLKEALRLNPRLESPYVNDISRSFPPTATRRGSSRNSWRDSWSDKGI